MDICYGIYSQLDMIFGCVWRWGIHTTCQFSYGKACIPSLSRFGGRLFSAKPTCTQVHHGSNIFEIWYFIAPPKSYPNSIHISILLLHILHIYIYICWMFLLFNMWIEPIKTWMSDKFTTSYGIFFFARWCLTSSRTTTTQKKQHHHP